nr:P-loop containing nucleoside triphosphate hydrolases superfamily protein [Tanacetum cinerariifolium]
GSGLVVGRYVAIGPQKRVACLMRKVQNNIFKTREEKYWSTISVPEALLNGTVESQR